MSTANLSAQPSFAFTFSPFESEPDERLTKTIRRMRTRISRRRFRQNARTLLARISRS